MRYHPVRHALACALLLFTCHGASQAATSSKVSVVKENGQYKLLRNGKPCFIKGVCGDGPLDQLVEAGGNSVRTFVDEDLGKQLTLAGKQGLTVTAGLWVGQMRKGFDWTDADSLASQARRIRATVEKYKDSPALLIWAIGNEPEDPEGKNVALWSEINRLARMVKEIDPNHPTMVVVAEIAGQKVQNINLLCPDIDIIGINSYAGAVKLGERYKKLGGTKPYLVTELGPPGSWECNRNGIGAFPERTSTEKAALYRRAYQGSVASQPDLCLGSYSFYWGVHQETTPTWFSMLLADHTRLGAVDVMQEMWTGKAPRNLCPVIHGLNSEGPDQVHPGATVKASLHALDPEDDPLNVQWILQRDSEEYGMGSDRKDSPPTYPEAIVKGDRHGAELRMPSLGGLYRLFAIVRDDHGGAAVANVPLRVADTGAITVASGSRTELPLVIYSGTLDAAPFVPSGWIGDISSIKLNPECATDPHSGKTCIRCDFISSSGWGGIAWQSPAGDWGDRGGGYNLTGARKLTFWARGEKGGEVVNFKYGLIGREKRFFDTASGNIENVKLTSEWQQYAIDVPEGSDLTRIKTGFCWSLESQGQPVTFYLDDIRWQ